MPARQLWAPAEGGDPLDDLADLVLAMTPAQLQAFTARLPHDDVDLVEQIMADRRAMGWRADPAQMAAHLEPARILLWAYVRLLGRKFREAVDGTDPLQLWNLPSRYGKSTLLRWGLTWCLDLHPAGRNILVSYGDELALEGAIEVRDHLRAHGNLLRCQLRPDRQRQDRFVTTEGGGLLASGIDGGITGFGAGGGGGVVVDDPFKNWQEAHSPTRREHVWNQLRSVVRLRLDDDPGAGSWMIVCHTRWHPEDPTGRYLQAMEDETGERFTLVRVPAIAEAPRPESPDPALRVADLLGRAPGEVIEPARFSVEAVAARHLAIGSYLTASMEQQRPAPEEGTEILRAWFRLEEQLPPKFDDQLTSWDMKLKDKEAGDYVVGQCWGRTGPDFWLRDQLRGQYDQATTTNAIALMQVRHPEVKRHVIENTGNGPEVMEALRKPQPGYVVSDDMAGRLGMTELEREQVARLRRRGMSGLVPNTPKGSKTVRARAMAPLAEGGNVHVPGHAAFTPVFLDEMASFPHGHDDQVDAWSQALSKLSRGAARVKAPSGQVQGPRPGRTSPTAAPPGPGPAPGAAGATSARAPRGSLPSRRGRLG